MIISDDRVKTITAFYEGYEGDEEHISEYVLHEIARGMILKLKEFHKVKVTGLGGTWIRAECSLQIIVPPRVDKDSAHTIPPRT